MARRCSECGEDMTVHSPEARRRSGQYLVQRFGILGESALNGRSRAATKASIQKELAKWKAISECLEQRNHPVLSVCV